MKLAQFSLLALSSIVFVGCAKNSPYIKEDIDDEIVEEIEEVMEDMDEMIDEDEVEVMDHAMHKMHDDQEGILDDDEEEKVTGNKEVKPPVEKVEPLADTTGQFVAYADGVIGNGEKSVLFFHAAWCPACKKNEALLNKFYEDGEYPISVYKIDYDTATELKKQFGVVSQDTFVVIDGDGNQLSSQTYPSETVLQSLIAS